MKQEKAEKKIEKKEPAAEGVTEKIAGVRVRGFVGLLTSVKDTL